MAVRYEEWKPARALDGVVAALWHVAGDDAGMPKLVAALRAHDAKLAPRSLT
jgi:hypothetical protein